MRIVERLARGDDHLLGDVAHPDEVLPQRLRDRGLRITQPGDLGDVRGEVTHPLQLGHHPQGGDQDSQLAGDWRLPREQRERPALHLGLLGVEIFVLGDHLLGQVDVGLQQRGR